MGREKEVCSSCCVQGLMASGRQLSAPAEQGVGKADRGHPTRALPCCCLQTCSSCMAQAWGNARAQPCSVLQVWGADCLEQCLLLKNDVFCLAERCPGRAALLATTTLRACCGHSSSCIHSSSCTHSSLAQSYVILSKLCQPQCFWDHELLLPQTLKRAEAGVFLVLP